jgi:hypothetical protein
MLLSHVIWESLRQKQETPSNNNAQTVTIADYRGVAKKKMSESMEIL